MTTNPSGYRPVEFNVVVRPAAVEEKTKGGIYLADDIKERKQFAEMEGELIAVSPFAFNYADVWPDGTKPKPGDRVLFAQYAGRPRKGKDGLEYRVVKDKDISAVLE